jgi:hypothetical protein
MTSLIQISKEQLKEAYKIIKRVQKYGDPNIVNKRGRKQVSPEHKKAVWNAWYQKQKQLKESNTNKEQLIIEKKSVGRPRKIKESTSNSVSNSIN